MPHTTNRTAFLQCDATEPLFRLYTLLVAVELALKDHTGAFGHAHDIDALALPLVSSNLQGVLNALEGTLKKLRCTHKNGTGVHTNLKKYPDLRYLRLTKDGFADGSHEADIMAALADAKQLVNELKLAGVHI